jgi:monoterpene epsilon-lactone hydrolase
MSPNNGVIDKCHYWLMQSSCFARSHDGRSSPVTEFAVTEGSPIRLAFRGSARSRAAAKISSLTLRQISAVLPPERPWGLWLSRQIVAGIMNTFGPTLAGTTVDAVDDILPDGRRVLGEWVRGPGVGSVADTKAAIYFLHGSGYTMCSPRTHRRLISWLSKLAALPVFCVDYRLAPQHLFPTAADDTHAGWDWLIGTCGLVPDRIVIAGDSAGGHLAVDLLLHSPTTPRSAALVLFSPLADLTFTAARGRERLRPDPAIRAADAARLVRLYSGETDLAHPRLTHDIPGAQKFPRTLIQAGGAEMLAADAHLLATAIRAGGGDCELQVWPDQVHVFQALPRLSPEATTAMRHAARFITESLSATITHAKAG